MIQALDLILFCVGLAAIGAGVALKDPAWSLVVVGSIVLATVLGSALIKNLKPRPAPGEPPNE